MPLTHFILFSHVDIPMDAHINPVRDFKTSGGTERVELPRPSPHSKPLKRPRVIPQLTLGVVVGWNGSHCGDHGGVSSEPNHTVKRSEWENGTGGIKAWAGSGGVVARVSDSRDIARFGYGREARASSGRARVDDG